jgi:hypothetical protein
MLRNGFSYVTDLSHVKQLSDQVVARGEAALGFEEYLELLLSACSTYDKIMSLFDLANAMCILQVLRLTTIYTMNRMVLSLALNRCV